jgi:tRNA dihydrouridine synthase A
MHSGFWKKLKRQIMSIAPMSGITDEAFRLMLLKHGRPDVFWTEFVSVDGLFSRGREALLPILKFTKAEHPIVAQVFGADPDLFEKTAVLIRKLGFDGIDINMGCPNKDVVKRGAGAALIKNPDLAKQIIRATKKGAGNLPVSVKTRIMPSEKETMDWISVLLEENIAVLTVHFRSKNESLGDPARWELAKKIVELRNRYAQGTLIFGNGGVRSLSEARQLAEKTGLDGIMIGRGAFEDPWFFSERRPDLSERLDAVVEHSKIFEKLYGQKEYPDSFNIVKKHFKPYATGFRGSKEVRERLMKAKSANEVEKIVIEIKKAAHLQ